MRIEFPSLDVTGHAHEEWAVYMLDSKFPSHEDTGHTYEKWAMYAHCKFPPLRLQDTPMRNGLCLCVTPISFP